MQPMEFRGQMPVVEVSIKHTVNNEIKLGSFEFIQPRITFPAPAETNIGLKTLREFALTFDQKNKRMKLVRQAERPPRLFVQTGPQVIRGDC